MIACGCLRQGTRGVAGGLVLAAVFAGAAWLRVVPPWPQVFRLGRVLPLSNDPWIHAHEVDDVLERFPRFEGVDPHRLHPGGQATGAPLFSWALAAAAWALGRGRPSPALVDRVVVFAPALLGALVVWPTYRLGRRLFGSASGLLAAALVAVLPGQLLQRSLLGYSDHHVAECLLSLATLAALAAALEAPAERRRHWRVLAGVALGAYLLTWASGMLLVFALVLAVVAQTWIDHGRPGTRPRLAAAVAWAFGVAFLATLPLVARPGYEVAVPVLAAGAAALLALERLSLDFERRGFGRGRLALACGASVLGASLLIAACAPGWVAELLALPRRLPGSATSATIAEARPLLWVDGRFSFAPLWLELGTSSVLGLLGLGLLARRAARLGRPADTLLLVWTLVAAGLTFAQARFAYYLAPPVALLAAWAVVTLCRGLAPAFTLAAALALALYPAARPALRAASAPDPGPSHAWVQALDWLRTATPDPWSGGARYGVLAWCDAGYWITRLARRAPVANPTQHGASEVAAFLLESDEGVARARLRALGARYLVLDATLLPEPHGLYGPYWLGQLDTLARWAHRDPSELYEVLLEHQAGGSERATIVYTPAYYRSMLVRLYAFGGQAAQPQDDAWAIETESAQDTRPARLVAARRFARDDEAGAFVATRPAGRARLLGRDPFRPCVPLGELHGYARVHASDAARLLGDGRRLPEVVIFEAREPHP